MEAVIYEAGIPHLLKWWENVKRCGICTLMGELGIREIVPAMCRLDYTMAEAGGTCVFERRYTLASGGPYCDCGYRKRKDG